MCEHSPKLLKDYILCSRITLSKGLWQTWTLGLKWCTWRVLEMDRFNLYFLDFHFKNRKFKNRDIMISLIDFVTNSFMFYSLPLSHLELQFHLKEILWKSMASWRSRYHLFCLRETELCKISVTGQTSAVIQNILDALLDLTMTG